MKPLNQAERKKAFGNFLLLFIITISVIVMVVFFSIRVPFEENKKMKEKIAFYQKEQTFAIQFSAKMTDPQILLSRLSTSKTDSVEFLKSQITNKLSELTAFKEKDSLANGSNNVYSKSLNALYSLQTAYSGLADYAKQYQNQGELVQENQNLKQRISDANIYILQLANSFQVKPPPPF